VWKIGKGGVQKKGNLIPGDLMRIGNKEGQRGWIMSYLTESRGPISSGWWESLLELDANPPP